MCKLTPRSCISSFSASAGVTAGAASLIAPESGTSAVASPLFSAVSGSSGALFSASLSSALADRSRCLRAFLAVFASALTLAASLAASFFDFGAVSGGEDSHWKSAFSTSTAYFAPGLTSYAVSRSSARRTCVREAVVSLQAEDK